MHVLLIHQVFIRPEDPGGTRHYEIAQQLVARGHRVTVLAGTRSYLTGDRLQADARQTLEPGLEVVRSWVLGGGGSGGLGRALAFATFLISAFLAGLRVRSVDLVWGTTPPLPQALAAWSLARLKRVRWLLEVRDLWPAFAIQLGVLRNRLLIGLAQRLERFLYGRADRIVVNSPGFLPHLLAAGARADKVALVPNGVDAQQFEREGNQGLLRQVEGLGDRFIALYAGAHGMANDLDQVLEAAVRLREDPRIAFVLVGDGREKHALQAKARAAGLTNVVFLPAIEKAAIPDLLAEADCGLVVLKPIPLFTTTYPNKLFDYMAAAKPVVLAIDGVSRMLVEEAEAGICVPPGDPAGMAAAVRRLAEDPGLAQSMGARGRVYVKAHYDRSQLALQMEGVMLGLVRARIG